MKKFLFDFFPILIFFAVFKLYGMFPATAAAIAASFVQNGLFWLKHRRFEKMHLVTLVMISVLGGATLLLHDRAFFMWKPTALYWLFAIVSLGSHFFGDKTVIERMLGHSIEVPKTILRRVNLAWVAFFAAIGVANLYVANFFFQANTTLVEAAGKEVDIDQCDTLGGHLLELCQHAKLMEDQWANFKVVGILGATFVFFIAVAFYLARHMPEEAATPVNEESEG